MPGATTRWSRSATPTASYSSASTTQLLELGIHGPITVAQRGALARIRNSEMHLLGLIEDVLNFAKSRPAG